MKMIKWIVEIPKNEKMQEQVNTKIQVQQAVLGKFTDKLKKIKSYWLKNISILLASLGGSGHQPSDLRLLGMSEILHKKVSNLLTNYIQMNLPKYRHNKDVIS